MRTVRLIDPALPPGDGRIVPILAQYGLDTFVEQGATVEVPDEVAGQAPTKDDLGHGLLAQTDVWADAAQPRTED